MLCLTGARVAVPIAMRGCPFCEAPDLRMAELLAGLHRMHRPAVARYAINAYGLTTAELMFRLAEPPASAVRLAQARVGTFEDSAPLWDAAGGLALDGFDYGMLNDTRVIDVRTRLAWLERVLPDYAPGPYEQLAAAYRRAGDEESSEQVLMERQRRRYAESGPAGRVWGGLQR